MMNTKKESSEHEIGVTSEEHQPTYIGQLTSSGSHHFSFSSVLIATHEVPLVIITDGKKKQINKHGE